MKIKERPNSTGVKFKIAEKKNTKLSSILSIQNWLEKNNLSYLNLSLIDAILDDKNYNDDNEKISREELVESRQFKEVNRFTNYNSIP
jgi:hypothetical protein